MPATVVGFDPKIEEEYANSGTSVLMRTRGSQPDLPEQEPGETDQEYHDRVVLPQLKRSATADQDPNLEMKPAMDAYEAALTDLANNPDKGRSPEK